MTSKGKWVLGLGAVLLGGWLLFRKKIPAAEITPTGAMTLEIIPAGTPSGYAGITPSPLVAGSTGNKAIVTVTNTSVYAGTAIKAPFTFNVGINIQVPDGTTTTWGSNLGTLFLAAGATGQYTWTFNIPTTATPGVGKGYAFIANPAVPLTAIASATPVAVTVNPEGRLFNVGVGIYDETVPKYVQGTILVDGVLYSPQYYEILSLLAGNHQFDLVVPPSYNFTLWKVYDWNTGEVIGQSQSRPIALVIDKPMFLQAIVQPGPAAPAITGTIEPGKIWNHSLQTWEILVSGQAIPQNKDIFVVLLWRNTSDVTFIGHVDLSVKYPSGLEKILFAAEYQDQAATPGGGCYVVFYSFLSSEAGIYTLTAKLSSGDILLSTVTFTVTAR